MPHKMINCSICSCTTTKRKSYALADGSRACREHEEAVEAHDLREALKKTDRRQHQLKKDRNGRFHSIRTMVDMTPICWGCGKQGFLEADFWLRMSKNQVRVEMSNDGGSIMAMQQKVNNLTRLDLMGLKVLRDFKLKPKDVVRGKWITHRDFKVIVEADGLTRICPDCAEKAKIDWHAYDLVTTAEDVQAGMILAELMKPALQEAVKREDEARAKAH